MVSTRTQESLLPQRIHHFPDFPSVYLGRSVTVDLFLPDNYESSNEPCHLMFFNDGQQWRALGLAKMLRAIHLQGKIAPVAVAAIHAGQERLQEYGTAAAPDYKARGSKASSYTFFVLRELLPQLEQRYRVGGAPERRTFAGFSLGGLSAFDIVFHHPETFSMAGILSGSFWWRRHILDDAYSQDDRIMQQVVQTGKHQAHQRYWFSAGTAEEEEDRNNNGVIDVIDDTLDMMQAMRDIGYTDDQLLYVELEGGLHHESSWGKLLPQFLAWAFPLGKG